MISAEINPSGIRTLEQRVWNKVTVEKQKIEFRGRVALEAARVEIKDQVAGLMSTTVGLDPEATTHRQKIDEHFYFNVVNAGGYLSANFGWQDDIGYYFLHGTADHVIEAREGSALHFAGKDGEEVFATRVNHPGTEPRLPEVRQAMALALAKSIYKHVYLRS